MPGKPGWCVVDGGGVPKNSIPWPKRAVPETTWLQSEGKRMVIHDTAFVAWCYDEKEGVLDQRRSKQLYGRMLSRKCRCVDLHRH